MWYKIDLTNYVKQIMCFCRLAEHCSHMLQRLPPASAGLTAFSSIIDVVIPLIPGMRIAAQTQLVSAVETALHEKPCYWLSYIQSRLWSLRQADDKSSVLRSTIQLKSVPSLSLHNLNCESLLALLPRLCLQACVIYSCCRTRSSIRC